LAHQLHLHINYWHDNQVPTVIKKRKEKKRNIWVVGRNDITIPLQQKFLKNTLGTADSEESFQRTLQKLGH